MTNDQWPLSERFLAAGVEEAFLNHIKTTSVFFLNKYEKYLDID